MSDTDRDALLDAAENDDEVVINAHTEPENSEQVASDVQTDVQMDSNVLGTRSTLWLTVICVTFNSLAHSLIGISVFVTLWFAFKLTPITTFQLHIVLNVIGYQLLMSQAILCLNSHSNWSTVLISVHQRRRVHWILQLAGSVIAIIGSAIMIREKTINFNTVHGKLALTSLIFTCIGLVNGVTSLYAVEILRFVPASVSKISHILLGTSAFALSSVCLNFGYNKTSFKEWASEEFAYLMIGVTSIYTLIVISLPCYNLYRKISAFCKIKVF